MSRAESGTENECCAENAENAENAATMNDKPATVMTKRENDTRGESSGTENRPRAWSSA
jgi:hypothetical protein